MGDTGFPHAGSHLRQGGSSKLQFGDVVVWLLVGGMLLYGRE